MKEKNSFIGYDNIYCYKDTNVLKNKLNIRDKARLDKAERQIIMVKLYILMEKTQNGLLNEAIYTEEYFKSLHRFIFDDIYRFAGNYRTINISKGAFWFADYRVIGSEIINIFSKLKTDFLKLNMFGDGEEKRQILIDLIAKYMADINVLHPFREGNGRVIREYFREIAYYNGYILSFASVDSEDLLAAMKISVVNTDVLHQLIDRSLYKR